MPAAKSIERDADGVWKKSDDYRLGEWFTVEPRSVHDIHELATLIANLEHDPLAFVIRGPLSEHGQAALAADANARLNRRKREKNGADKAHWQDGGTSIIWDMIDMDDLDAGDFDFINDPEGYVRHVIATELPSFYEGASCFWQYSARSGTYKGGNPGLHLWFWYDRPVDLRLFRRWVETERPKTDKALYMEVQPHLLTAPVFKGGAVDPIKQRSGFIQGARDVVTLPEIRPAEVKQKVKQKKQAAAAQKKARGKGKRTVGLLGSGVQEAIALMGDGPGLEGFHGPLTSAIWHFVKSTHPDLRDWTAFKSTLRRAIGDAPANENRQADLKRYTHDLFLDTSYRDATHKLDNDRPAPPEKAKQGVSLTEAQERTENVIMSVLNGDVTRAAIAASTGVGKTALFLKNVAESGLAETLRIHMYVPTNELSKELLDRAKNAGIENARMHRGRMYQAKDIEPYCHPDMQEQAGRVEAVRGDVRATVCGRCPYLETCGWEKQRQDRAPGLIIMPQEYAFLPTAEKADIQVFDEAFWQTGIEQRTLELSWLNRIPRVPYRGSAMNSGATDMDAQNDLFTAHQRLQAAIDNWDGTPAPLGDAGLTPEVARRAEAICHQRADSLNERLKSAQPDAFGKIIGQWQHEHGTARKEAAFWRILGKELERDRPLQAIRIIPGLKGEEIEFNWRRDLKAQEAWTLVMDATAITEVLEPYLPGIELTTVNAAAPRQRIVQITDEAYGKSAIAPDIATDDAATARRKENRLNDVAAVLEVARAVHKSVGVITYLNTKAALEERGALDGLVHGHYGNIAGKDEWRNVDALFTFGRTEPKPFAVEAQARGLFYDSDTPLSFSETGAYVEADDAHWTKDGQHVLATRRAHSDPRIDAVRRQIVTANLMQSDRTRGVQRAPDRPVTWYVVTNEPLPVPVDELWTNADLVPSKWQVAAARGLFATNPKHAAALHPDLWANAKAAVNDRDRNGWAEVDLTSYKGIYLIGSEVNLARVRYKPEGAGQKPTYLLASDPESARENLGQRVGPLAEFSVLNEPAAEPRLSEREPDDRLSVNQTVAELIDFDELRRQAREQRLSLYHAMVKVPPESLDLLRQDGIEAAPKFKPQLSKYKPAPTNGAPSLPAERLRELLMDWPNNAGSWAIAPPWEPIGKFQRKRTPFLLEPEKDVL